MINKFRGAIVGTAIGDALGAPMETMWAGDIARKFPDFNKEKCQYVSKGKRKKGEWTDDTQLMIPTARSIVVKGGIHPADIAKRYVEVAENEEKRGWGRSTIRSVARLAEGMPWFEASEESLGIGNGAAMKAAPLGLALSHAKGMGVVHCLNSIIGVGKITHKDIGIRAGLLQSVLVSLAVHDYKGSKTIISQLKHYENDLFGSVLLSKKTESLFQKNSISAICDHGGVTSKADESWPTTAAVYLKTNKINAISNLFELIRQGGDCDTTGAMFGALIGARFGVDIFPNNLLIDLEKVNELESLAMDLYTAVQGYDRT